MEWTIPGTTLTARREDADKIDRMFQSMFLPGGMVLSQVASITGLEAYTIQNWVKRGFLPSPKGKRYDMEQLCRILNINMLKGVFPLEKICRLLSYINGSLSDESDDLVDDTLAIGRIMRHEFCDGSFILFGHSMGSFIARDYMATYGQELSGVTLCGTAGEFRGALEAAKTLREVVGEGKGEERDPQVAADLMGWMCEYCGDIKIGNEWICSDPYVQQDHAMDPFDAFTKPTSNRSMYDFTQMMEVINGTEWAKKVPVSLPVYNIAGDLDPVGEYGEGVYAVTSWLRATGHNVKTKLYSGYRHEIHNYNDIKDEVEAGIIAFMNENL